MAKIKLLLFIVETLLFILNMIYNKEGDKEKAWVTCIIIAILAIIIILL